MATCHCPRNWDLWNCIASHRLSLNWPISGLEAMPQKMRREKMGEEPENQTDGLRSRILGCNGGGKSQPVALTCACTTYIGRFNYNRYMPGNILLGHSVTLRLFCSFSEFSGWPLHSYLNMHISSSCFWFFWISGSEENCYVRCLLTSSSPDSSPTPCHLISNPGNGAHCCRLCNAI